MYATVQFDTKIVPGADAAEQELVFWFVAWIQDSSGRIVAEVADHGMAAASLSGRNFANITDVPIQAHSNNVGIYGTFGSFHLEPPSASVASQETARTASAVATDANASPVPLASAAEAGPLASISLSLPNNVIPVDRKAKLRISYQAGKAFPGSTVTLYDGNPANGGKMIDFQRIHRLSPGAIEMERTFFRPTSCGRKTLYAVSNLEGFKPTIGKTNVIVDMNPVDYTRFMIQYLRGANVPNQERRVLLYTLRNAEDQFWRGQQRRALAALAVFDTLLRYLPGLQSGHLKDQMDVLVGDSQRIRSCEIAFRAAR